jgi:hypothetical protein
MFKKYNLAHFILCLSIGAVQQGCISNSSVKQNKMNIVGNWTKVKGNACSEKYPDEIEFKHNGIYQAQAANETTMHPVWDAGTFELNGNSINISTSNDAVIKYAVEMDNETASFNDPDGCTIKYKRLNRQD